MNATSYSLVSSFNTGDGALAVIGGQVKRLDLSVFVSALANQSANLVFAGPTSGGATAPTFRALVSADMPSGVALLGTANTFTAQQNFGVQTLTDGTTISWNLATQQSAAVTLGGNRTLANPTNIVAGGTYVLVVTQDGTGSRTLGYGTAYKWAGGGPPTLSTAAGSVDVLTFVGSPDGTKMLGTCQKGFS